MPIRDYHFHGGQTGAALSIRVMPRSSRNEISEIQSDGTVKIKLTAPPVDGKANEALIAFLAQILGISRSKIEIIAGKTGRDKLVSVLDLDADTVNDRIQRSLPKK